MLYQHLQIIVMSVIIVSNLYAFVYVHVCLYTCHAVSILHADWNVEDPVFIMFFICWNTEIVYANVYVLYTYIYVLMCLYDCVYTGICNKHFQCRLKFFALYFGYALFIEIYRCYFSIDVFILQWIKSALYSSRITVFLCKGSSI